MEDMVHVKINGIAVEVPKGSTILEAARYAGVEIPTLCFLKDINESAPAASAWWKPPAPAAW